MVLGRITMLKIVFGVLGGIVLLAIIIELAILFKNCFDGLSFKEVVTAKLSREKVIYAVCNLFGVIPLSSLFVSLIVKILEGIFAGGLIFCFISLILGKSLS